VSTGPGLKTLVPDCSTRTVLTIPRPEMHRIGMFNASTLSRTEPGNSDWKDLQVLSYCLILAFVFPRPTDREP
jgi:hypothetical protein